MSSTNVRTTDSPETAEGSAIDLALSRGVNVTRWRSSRGPLGSPSCPARSYFAYASFSDPEGNGWVLQEITARLPGREWED